jgi:membrane protease YdiL (CAAX protease family)
MTDASFHAAGLPWRDPKADRQRRLRRFLVALVALAGVMALAAVLLPGAAGEVAGAIALGLVIAAPLARVAWLGVRWWRKGDRRFALTALAVLLVVAVGVALA